MRDGALGGSSRLVAESPRHHGLQRTVPLPVELSNDSLGYLITRDAWEGGGYEALISRGTFIDVAGVELMVDRVTEMLCQLYRYAP